MHLDYETTLPTQDCNSTYFCQKILLNHEMIRKNRYALESLGIISLDTKRFGFVIIISWVVIEVSRQESTLA